MAEKKEEKKSVWDKIKDSFKQTAEEQKAKFNKDENGFEVKDNNDDDLFQDDVIVDMSQNDDGSYSPTEPVAPDVKIPEVSFPNPSTPSGSGGSNGVLDLLGGGPKDENKPAPKPKPMEKTEAEKAKEAADAAKKKVNNNKAYVDSTKAKADEAYKANEVAKADYEKKQAAVDAAKKTNKGINDKYDQALKDINVDYDKLQNVLPPVALKQKNDVLESLGLPKLGLFDSHEDFVNAIEGARKKELEEKGVDVKPLEDEAYEAKNTYRETQNSYEVRYENAQTAANDYNNSKQEYNAAQSAYEDAMEKGVTNQTKEEQQSLRDKIKNSAANQPKPDSGIFDLGHGKDTEGPFVGGDTTPSTPKPSTPDTPSQPVTPETNPGLSQEELDRLEAERQAKLPYEAMANQRNAYKKSFKGWEFGDDGYKPIYDYEDGVSDNSKGPQNQQNRVEQNIQSNQESVKSGEGIEVNKIGKDPADTMKQPGVANSVVGTSVGTPNVGSAGETPVNFDNSRSYSDKFTDGGFAERSKNVGLAPEGTENFAEDPWNQGMEQQSNTVVSDKQMKVFIKHCHADPVMKRVAALIKEKM